MVVGWGGLEVHGWVSGFVRGGGGAREHEVAVVGLGWGWLSGWDGMKRGGLTGEWRCGEVACQIRVATCHRCVQLWMSSV